MSEYYRVDIAGMERDLLRCPISDKLDIAAFILFGDVEITVHSAQKLLEKLPEFDYIVTPEAKSIPLAYEMARQSGKKYFVARKKASQLMTLKIARKYPITPELVLKCATGSTAVFEQHIMHALMECGLTDKIYGDLYKAFTKQTSSRRFSISC